MVIIPEMLYKKVLIHNGKEWILVDIKPGNAWSQIRRVCSDKKKSSSFCTWCRCYKEFKVPSIKVII